MSGVGRTVIRGGLVVGPTGQRVCDVAVEDGRIVALDDVITAPAAEVIDARGCFVLPGAIDAHTHIQAEQGQFRTVDTFTTGTAAAARGGTTCVVDFALQHDGQDLEDAVRSRIHDIEAEPPIIDVGLHVIVRDISAPNWKSSLERALNLGASDIKVYMAHKNVVMIDDPTILQVMQVAAELGALVLVHPENGDVVDWLREEYRSTGRSSVGYHRMTRPSPVEAEAVHRAAALAEMAGCSIYLVHVSSRDAMDALQSAQADYPRIWGETCPQYLVLDESVLVQDPTVSSRFVCSPPLRAKENQDALWEGLRSGGLSTLASDHSAFALQDKESGAHDFKKCPAGLPGVEERMALLHHFGVSQGRLSLEAMVRALSTEPARLLGLADERGTVTVGALADVVVFDPTQHLGAIRDGFTDERLYSAYAGTPVVGAPDVVLKSGKVVVRHGELVGEPGDGSFVKRRRIGRNFSR